MKMVLFETSGNLIIALGKTIIHSVWMGLLILAMLRAVLIAIPGRLSNLRYLLSVSSMLFLAGAVLATFTLLFAPGNQAVSDFRMFESLRIVPQIMVLESPAESLWKPNLLFILCSYFYFAGMVFMVLRSALSYRYTRSLRSSGRKVNGDWQARLKRISALLGIQREVHFLQSDQVSGPLLIGILKPAVIVPIGMFTHLSVSQVESILIHELYHLKRLDHLVNIMQLFMEGVLFYNPAIWLISDIIRREREHSCDDGVVLTSNDPFDYAKALVKLAEQQQYVRLVPAAGGSRRHHFAARINRIINRSNMKKNKQERMMSLLVFVGAMVLVVTISGFSSGFSILKQSDRIPEISVMALTPVPAVSNISIQDTIREPKKPEPLKEREEMDWDQIKEDMEAARLEAREAMEEIDWDQIKEDMEAARLEAREAMEEIDWDQIKEDMKAAHLEAMEEIDWDQIKEDMKAAKEDALVDMDWDKMKAEMDSVIQEIDLDFDMDFDMDFDVEAIREIMEEARREMKEIDWEEMKQEMERSFSEMQIDVEEMKREIKESIEDIDWEEIRKDMENTRRELDSLSIEKDI
jgi:beta-lactamase regulating signal transducer with metallopeptidase domain